MSVILLVGVAQFCERSLHAKIYPKLGRYWSRLFFSPSAFSIMVVILCTWPIVEWLFLKPN